MNATMLKMRDEYEAKNGKDYPNWPPRSAAESSPCSAQRATTPLACARPTTQTALTAAAVASPAVFEPLAHRAGLIAEAKTRLCHRCAVACAGTAPIADAKTRL